MIYKLYDVMLIYKATVYCGIKCTLLYSVLKYYSLLLTSLSEVSRASSVKMGNRKAYEEVERMQLKVFGINIFPLLVWIFNIIPDSWRRIWISKKNAPRSTPGSELKDIFDLTGGFPYEKEEVIPGKLWAVTYRFEEGGMTRESKKREAKALQWNPASPEFQEKCLEAASMHGPRAVEACKKDLEKFVKIFTQTTFSDEELSQLLTAKMRMFVVRLSVESLLLYSPCRIREETGLKHWLDSLGTAIIFPKCKILF